MARIINGTVVLDQAELTWFADNYGTTEWVVYVAGMDEIVTHDKQGPGDDPAGEPLTEATARELLAEFDRRFGPGSPMDRELPGDPMYAVALHYGKPAFGSHERSHAINPPGGSFANPGDCACGHTWAEVEKGLAAAMAETEWSVYVTGPNVNLVAQGQDIDDFEPCGPPFTEETAKEHAAAINTAMARAVAEKPSPFNPVVRAVVLHHGQPVTETANLCDRRDVHVRRYDASPGTAGAR